MHNSDQVTFQLLYLQDQQSSMLHWHSFLEAGSNILTRFFAYKGGQYIDYGLMSLHSPWGVQDERRKIFDAPVSLIFKMGQRACRLPIYL